MRHFAFVGVWTAILGCATGTHEVLTPEPQLKITSPAPAAWVADGALEVTGVAVGFDEIDVNGTVVPVVDDAFVAEIVVERGIQMIDVRGKNDAGDTRFVRESLIVGTFATTAAMMEDAVEVRVNRAGLNKAVELVDAYIVPSELAASAKAVNPVYEDSYSVWGWEAATVTADVDFVSFEQPQLSLLPESNRLWIEANVPNLFVEVGVSGEVAGMDYDEPVWLESSTVEVTGYATIEAVDGRLNVDIVDPSIRFLGFYFDVELLPGEIENDVLGDVVRAQLEEMLLEKIEESIPALLEDTLAGLDLSHSMELLDQEVELQAEFGHASVDPQGIAVKMDVQMGIPSAGDRYYQGFLTTSGVKAPTLDRVAGLSAAMSDDLINRLLFEAWRGSMMDMTLSTEDESLPAGSLHHFQAETGTVSLYSHLPPVLVEKDGQTQLQLGEVDVVVSTPGGGLGEHLEASLTAYVDVDMEAVDGVLTVDLGSVEVFLMVRESDWGASREAITRMLEENLPIETLLSMVKDFEFPIPTLEGITVDRVALDRDANQMYTNIVVDFD